MKLAYEWCIGTKPKQAEQKLGHGSKTITVWYGFFRQMVSSHFKTYGDEQIGGVNVVVQIDESKFAKRKYHRGHRVGDGSWVFGGIDTNKKVFAVSVPDRTRATLIPILDKYVKPGSIIYLDGFSAYWDLEIYTEAASGGHWAVIHDDNYVDPDSGVHTNNIEAICRPMKSLISNRSRGLHRIDVYLREYIWRKANCNTLWDSLLEAMATVVQIDENGII